MLLVICGVVVWTKCIASERTPRSLLLSLALWMPAAGEKQRCEVVRHASGVTKMEVERFGCAAAGGSGNWDRTFDGGRSSQHLRCYRSFESCMVG